MVFLNDFLRKKGFHPLGVRPWICVFLIFKNKIKIIQMGHEAMSVLTVPIF
jgi:hypothetical protein